MGTLDGFRSFDFSEGAPYLSITKNGATFNQSVVKKLDYAQYAVLLINEEERKIAIQSCDESRENAIEFYKPKKSKIISVRLSGRDLLVSLSALMGWNLENCGYKATGIFLREEHAVVFDLTTAIELK